MEIIWIVGILIILMVMMVLYGMKLVKVNTAFFLSFMGIFWPFVLVGLVATAILIYLPIQLGKFIRVKLENTKYRLPEETDDEEDDDGGE